jgi:hypothetical protein
VAALPETEPVQPDRSDRGPNQVRHAPDTSD